ncbi:MAG: hypothetical protein LUG85_02010 [Clostridiales bacterium]|nr:hypothetical protein [Clostridiales bacterium]
MKKIISIILAAVIFCSLGIYGFADDAAENTDEASARIAVYGDGRITATVGGEERCMIFNEYYTVYYNDLLEQSYSLGTDETGLQSAVLDAVTEGTFAYVTVILKDKTGGESYADYNREILGKILSEDEILYAADTVPAAVIKLTYEKKAAVTECEDIVFVREAFFNNQFLINYIVYSNTLGNVKNDESGVTASSARYILRFSAGLDTVERNGAKQFYFLADVNLDNKVTTADARHALRAAAGLDEAVEFSMSYADYMTDFD